jgi:hypothetical protein
MNKYMFNLILGVCFGLLIGVVSIYQSGVDVRGDMNDDGVLNITDLSILAEVIRNQ